MMKCENCVEEFPDTDYRIYSGMDICLDCFEELHSKTIEITRVSSKNDIIYCRNEIYEYRAKLKTNSALKLEAWMYQLNNFVRST